MSLSLENEWVWDSWYYPQPVNGSWHGYHLTAPKNFIDPELRHRDAKIGYSTSTDLVNWAYHGIVIAPGDSGSWNDRAIWTGCIVLAQDGTLHNFYTSTNATSEAGSIQRIGCAVGVEFGAFEKTPLVIEANGEFYERLDRDEIEESKIFNSWKEEAWRDPWVFFDDRDGLWHMLITARLNFGNTINRGTVGHATSVDLENWLVKAPLTGNTSFAHLEVIQVVETSIGWILVFCTGENDIDPKSEIRAITGTFSAPADSPTGPFHLDRAEVIDDGSLYAGRVIKDTDGSYKLLGFENGGERGFTGVISDPIPLLVTERGTFKMI